MLVKNLGRKPRNCIGGPSIQRTSEIRQPLHPATSIVLVDRRYDTKENNGQVVSAARRYDTEEEKTS